MVLSIPAWFDWRASTIAGPVMSSLTFNPSLVRLAPPQAAGGRDALGAFQSQLGSIGARSRFPSRSPAASFQSQLGSIGALALQPEGRQRRRLSIPAWFDWRSPALSSPWPRRPTFNPSLVRLARCPAGMAPCGASCFQSQLGSIGAFVRRGDAARYLLLSIPAWFDWRLMPHARPGGQMRPFQSQLGSIGAGFPEGLPLEPQGFQSQLGSIGALWLLPTPSLTS